MKNIFVCSPVLYAWNDNCEASIATEIGPTVATASLSACSLPDGTSVNPTSVAPIDFFLNLHFPSTPSYG